MIVDLGVALRVEVDILRIARQAVSGFAEFDAGVVQQFQQRGQLVVERRQLAKFGVCPAECTAQREFAVAIEQFDHAGGAFGQTAGVGEALVVRLEFVQFGGRQRPFFQFADFVPQQFDALVTVVATAEFAHARAQFAPLHGTVAYLRQQLVVTGVGIQQGQLVRPRQQRLMLVLAVDLDQQRGQFAKLAGVRGAAIDPCLGAALGTNHPAQLTAAVLVQFLALQPVAGLGQVGQIELGSQFRAIAAGTHHATVGAGAGQQHQRIDQQRLAGAGLAADHGKSRAERDLGFFDNGEMTDVERSKHGGGQCGVGRL